MDKKHNECMWCKKKHASTDVGLIADGSRESDIKLEEIWKDRWYCSEKCYNAAVAHCKAIADINARRKIMFAVVSPRELITEKCPECGEKIPDMDNGKYVIVKGKKEDDGLVVINCIMCPHCRAILKSK